jgi:hypothetical protein
MDRGSWKRIRNDEGKYRGAYIGAFRAFFEGKGPLVFNTYNSYYVFMPQGEESPGTLDDIYMYKPLIGGGFDTDSDFSGYDDDDPTGIVLHTADYVGEHKYFDLYGRPLDRKPTKGIYINNGKKIFVK